MSNQLTVEQLERYSKGGHPKKLHPQCTKYAESNLQFLSEVEQLGFEQQPFEQSEGEYNIIMKIMRAAKLLEVLVCKGCNEPLKVPMHLDEFCDEFSCFSTFWSTVHIFNYSTVLPALGC